MEIKQKFQSSDILISRVKENLSSYDNAGIIDEGKFYFLIKDELRLLGEYVYITKTDVVTLNNKKALLPKDFIQLYALYNVDAVSKKVSVEGQLLPKITYKAEFMNIETCKTDEYIVTESAFFNHEYNSRSKGKLLKYNSKVNTDLCYKYSPNFTSTSANEFNIDKNYIYTNLTDGDLYLEYLAFPYDEEGFPMIPDESKIEKTIENRLMFEVFRDFYINDITNNALQKMQYFQAEYNLAHKIALNHVKLPSFQQMTEMAYKNVNKFSRIKNMVYGR